MLRGTDPGMGMHPIAWDTARPLVSRSRAVRLVRLILLAGAAVAGFGWLLSHDPASGLALSGRGWLTIAVAAVVAVLLAGRRGGGFGPLVRALAEYAVVAVLGVLLVTAAGATPSPATLEARARAQAAAQAAGACPPVLQVRAWLSCLWHQASEASKDHQAQGNGR